jgi:hypothetical protein
MIMPHDDGINAGLFRQVNLHPLFARPQFHPGTFIAALVAVRDQVQRADHGIAVAGGDFFAQRNIGGARRHQEIRPLVIFGSRFGTLIGTGVPTNNGGGKSVFNGTLSSACAVKAENHAASV